MEKPSLVVLSGWAVKDQIWNNIIDFLNNHFNVILVNWDKVSSLKEFRERAVSVIEKNKLKEYSILGWSLGSLVAQELALDKSYSIKNLILFSATTSFVSHKEEGYPIGWNKRIVERMIAKLNLAPKEVLVDFFNNTFSQEEKDLGYRGEVMNFDHDYIEVVSIASLKLGLEYLIKMDLRGNLGQINARNILLIHGDEDNICSKEGAQYMQTRLGNCNLEIIKGCGHIPFYTNPNQCTSIIEEFIFRCFKK